MPFVPASTPITSIKSVTDSVPQANRDNWYWPCMTGEAFPPVLGTATYGNHNGYPVISLGSASHSAAWPLVSRVAYSGRSIVTMKCRSWYSGTLGTGGTATAATLAVVGISGAVTLGAGNPDQAWFSWPAASDPNCRVNVTDGAGTLTSQVIAAPGQDVMHVYSIELNPTSTVFRQDGVVIATLPATNPLAAGRAIVVRAVSNGTDGGSQYYITQMSVDYS